MANLSTGGRYKIIRSPLPTTEVTNVSTYHANATSYSRVAITAATTYSRSLETSYEWYYAPTGELVCMSNGKALSLTSNPTSGSTVAQLANKNSNLQQAPTIATTGGTAITVNGKTYQPYRIVFGNFCLGTASSTSGVMTAYTTPSDANTYTWYFIPVSDMPDILSGTSRFYKIRLADSPNTCAYYSSAAPKAIEGRPKLLGDAVDETNACVWNARTSSGGAISFITMSVENAQTSPGWNAASTSPYNVVVGNFRQTINPNHNVFVPTRTTGNSQTIEGYRLYPQNFSVSGLSRYLSYSQEDEALPVFQTATSGSEVVEVLAQPARPTRSSIPSPVDLSFSTRSGVYELTGSSTTSVPLSWKMPGGWTPSDNTFFEVRSRRRTYDSGNGWGAWGNWSTWNPIPYTASGGRCHASIGTGSLSTYYVEIEVQARAVSDEYASTYVDAVLSWFPSVTASPSFQVGPDGYHLSFTGTGGATRFDVLSMTRYAVERLAKPYSYDSSDESDLIPFDSFRSLPPVGETQTLVVDIHLMPPSTLTSRSTPAATPVARGVARADSDITLVESGNRVIAVVRHYGTTRVFVGDNEHGLCECYPAQGYNAPSGYKAYEIPYPAGKAFTVSAISATNPEDYSQTWAIGSVDHAAINKPFHGFYWDGGCLVLSASNASGSVETSNEPVYERNVLDNRKRESVSFATTVKVSKNVTGAFVDADGVSADFANSMTEAGHVVYRSPLGGLHLVAIAGCSVSEHNGYTVVDISMIEEE